MCAAVVWVCCCCRRCRCLACFVNCYILKRILCSSNTVLCSAHNSLTTSTLHCTRLAVLHFTSLHLPSLHVTFLLFHVTSVHVASRHLSSPSPHVTSLHLHLSSPCFTSLSFVYFPSLHFTTFTARSVAHHIASSAASHTQILSGCTGTHTSIHHMHHAYIHLPYILHAPLLFDTTYTHIHHHQLVAHRPHTVTEPKPSLTNLSRIAHDSLPPMQTRSPNVTVYR